MANYTFERRPINPEWIIQFNENLQKSSQRKLEAELKLMEIDDCWDQKELLENFQREYANRAFDDFQDEESAYAIFANDQLIAAETLNDFGNIIRLLDPNMRYSSRDLRNQKEINLLFDKRLYETFSKMPIDFINPF